MKHLIALASVIIALPVYAADKPVVIKDSTGRTVGRIVEGYSGGGVERKLIIDGKGARIGSIERQHGRTSIYDQSGRIGRLGGRSLRLDDEDSE